MALTFDPGVEDAIVEIAAKGSMQAQREVAKVVAFLKKLDESKSGPSQFWNVVGAARGRLTSVKTCPNGNAIWRLYPSHTYCAALLLPRKQDIVAIHVCGKHDMKSFEDTYC